MKVKTPRKPREHKNRAAPPVQYTLRGVPRETDAALRERARGEGVSLNSLAVEILKQNAANGTKKRDLSDLAGSWAADPEFDKAMADQRRIDWEAWK